MASRIDLHGTAQLRRHGEYKIGEELTGDRGIRGVVLGVDGEDAEGGTIWWTHQQQGHGLTFGATRSGKGVSAIIPALLMYGGSAIVIDPKGENAFASAERRRQLGQRVVILDPWNEVNRRYGQGHQVEQTTRFNPLSAIRPDSPDFNDDVTAIADALVIQTGSDPHWSDSARELIAGLVAAVIEQQPGAASLGDVRKLLAKPAPELANIIADMVKANPASLAARKLSRFASDGTEVASIRSTALTQTAVLDSLTLQAAMETDDPPFDLAELATGWVTLYLVLPLDRLQSHGRWLRLILTLAIRAIARQAEPPKDPVLFLLDEFGTIGKLTMIEQAFGLMAGIGVRVWAFLQDLNQLKRDYPQSWETFIANCSILQVLNARDTTTSSYFADYLGSQTLEVITSETQKKRESILGDPGHASVQDSVHGRPIMYPEEIRRLPSNSVLIFEVGRGAIQQRRITYYEHPIFVGRYRHLPAFPPQKRKVKNVDQATAKIKAAGQQIRNKMLGGWTVTNMETGKATNISNDAELMAYADALP